MDIQPAARDLITCCVCLGFACPGVGLPEVEMAIASMVSTLKADLAGQMAGQMAELASKISPQLAVEEIAKVETDLKAVTEAKP